MVDELPLIELFTQLREAGLPLGIDEYKLLLAALEKGFGVSDRSSLYRLCKTLWVKSLEDKHLLDYYFERLIPQFEEKNKHSPRHSKIGRISPRLFIGGCFIIGFLAILFIGVNRNQILTPNFTNNPDIKNIILYILLSITVSIIIFLLSKFVIKWITERRFNNKNSVLASSAVTLSSPLSLRLIAEEDEVQVVKTNLKSYSKNDEIIPNRSIMISEYLPLTKRQMKQIWRSLRRPVRQGPLVELDIEATVNRIGRQGIFLEPLLVARRINWVKLLLLIDRDGSMVPFHALSDRLVQTAVRGGGLGNAEIYYFHNCPVEYLYHDPYHLEAKLITNLLLKLNSDRSVMLIFSDAGAARGGYSQERIELTEAFLKQIKTKVRYIAWLNPMPKSRWDGTTAGRIAQILPMFELTRRGLQDAITCLRGR